MINVWKVSTVGLAIALGVSIGGGAIRTANAGPQPKMEAALKALTNAQNALQNAEADKAGHREKAIGLVGQAISEVNQGIAAGK
jgi:hypothetical protein